VGIVGVEGLYGREGSVYRAYWYIISKKTLDESGHTFNAEHVKRKIWIWILKSALCL